MRFTDPLKINAEKENFYGFTVPFGFFYKNGLMLVVLYSLVCSINCVTTISTVCKCLYFEIVVSTDLSMVLMYLDWLGPV
jgi:hypothetical protein